MNQSVLHQPGLTCSGCGKFGAYAFDGENLCVDCYQSGGSCCAEREISDAPAPPVFRPAPAPGEPNQRTPSFRPVVPAPTVPAP